MNPKLDRGPLFASFFTDEPVEPAPQSVLDLADEKTKVVVTRNDLHMYSMNFIVRLMHKQEKKDPFFAGG